MPTIKYDRNKLITDWLTENPCPGIEPGQPTINLWIASAARACHTRRVSPERAVEVIRGAMTRDPKPREIERTVERIYDGVLSTSPTPSANVSNIEFNPDLLAERASRVPFEITDEWLAERSPHSLMSPAEYLDAIFKPEERVAVLPIAKYDKGFIYQPGSAKHARRLITLLKHNKEGAWYICNPVTGTCINGSLRSEANLTSYRHLLLESDKAERQLWLRVIVQLHVPILAIYESGNRSVHALVRITASNRAEFDV